MTVQKLYVKNKYIGDGNNTVFPITFEWAKKHPESIQVWIRNSAGALGKTDNFMLKTSSNEDIWDVVYPSVGEPLGKGESIIIVRELPLLQVLNLVNQGPYFADDIEITFDEIVMMIQQLNERLARSFKVAVDIDGENTFDTTVPIEPGKTFRVKDDGTGFEVTEDPKLVYEKTVLEKEQAAAQARAAALSAESANRAAQKAYDDHKALIEQDVLDAQRSANASASSANRAEQAASTSAREAVENAQAQLKQYLTSANNAKFDAQTAASASASSANNALQSENNTEQLALEINNKWNNILSKTDGVVTPQMFGAVGDGVSDDSDALNAAMRAAEGKTLNLLGKTYKVSKLLYPSNNSIIKGDGAKIIGGANSNFGFFVTEKNNVTISGIEFTNLRRAIDIRYSENINVSNVYAHDMFRDAPLFEDNYMIVIIESNNINVSNVEYYNDNLNSDGIRIKNNCKNINVEHIRGYCKDAFLVMVTDEDNVSTQQQNIKFDDVLLSEENYCGVQIEMRSNASSIKNLVFNNCQLAGSLQGEPIRFANSTDGYHEATHGIGTLEDLQFTNCKFILSSSSDGARPFGRFNSININNMFMSNCTFINNYARTDTGTVLEFEYCKLENATFNNLTYRSTVSALNYMFNFKAESNVVDAIIDNCIYIGKSVSSNTAHFIEINCNANLTVANCRLTNSRYLINAGGVSGSIVASNNKGQTYTYNAVSGNTMTVMGGGNFSISNNDISNVVYRLNGDFRTNKTPTTPTKGDHYVYSDSATAKYRVYTGTSWS